VEVANIQTCQQESIERIETIIRDELKKLKMETRAAPASGPRPLHFPFSGDPLKGIIAFLTEKCGGNVIDKGIVKILAGEAESARAEVQSRNIADLRAASARFASIASPGHSIGYDFQDRGIELTAYSVRAWWRRAAVLRPVWKVTAAPKSWIVEVCDDPASGRWTAVDEHTNTKVLRGSESAVAFTLSKSVRCRCVRIRQKDMNNRHSHQLVIAAFEVFGSLIE
jgi:hypothetical protein